MPITRIAGPQQQKLFVALLAVFPTYFELDSFFQFNLSAALATIAANTLNMREVVLTVIRWALQNDTRLFLTEVSAYRGEATLSAVCAELIASIDAQAPAPATKAAVDPLAAVILDGGLPFVDRKGLRDVLPRIADQNGPRVVVVHGPPRAGKSYCFELLRHATQRKWSHVYLAPLDLAECRTTSIHPRDLVRRLAQELRVKEEPPIQRADQTDPIWIGELVVWLAKQAPDDGLTWVVLGGFDHPDVPPLTHDLIAELALRASQRLEKLCVILLGYDRTRALPPRVNVGLRTETIDVLSELELATFFDEVKAQYTCTSQREMAMEQFLESYRLLPAGDPQRLDALQWILPRVVGDLA